jgi:hypothetical protein
MQDLKTTILLFVLRFLLGSIDCLNEFRERLDGWRIDIKNRRIDRLRERQRRG